MNKKLIGGIVIIIILTIGGFLLYRGGQKGTAIREVGQAPQDTTDAFQKAVINGDFVSGQMAPGVTFVDFRKNTHSLSDFKGRAVVLDFWASWCPPCRAEMPILQSAHEQYGDNLVMIGVHRGDTESKATGERFANGLGINYLLVVDPDGSLYQAATVHSFAGMPVAVFIDREGIVQEVKVGAKTSGEIEEKISNLISD